MGLQKIPRPTRRKVVENAFGIHERTPLRAERRLDSFRREHNKQTTKMGEEEYRTDKGKCSSERRKVDQKAKNIGRKVLQP